MMKNSLKTAVFSGYDHFSTYLYENGQIGGSYLHTVGITNEGSKFADSKVGAMEIPVNTTHSGTISYNCDVWYRFVANSSALHPNGEDSTYTFHFSICPYFSCHLYDSAENLIASYADYESFDATGTITAPLSFGETYYFRFKNEAAYYEPYSLTITDGISPVLPISFGPYVTRTYLKFTTPTLPHNIRIKKAELKLPQAESCCASPAPLLGIYELTEGFDALETALISEENLLGTAQILPSPLSSLEDGVEYVFDVTDLIERIARQNVPSCYFALKLLDETQSPENFITLFEKDVSCYSGPPAISITYETPPYQASSTPTKQHDLGNIGSSTVDLLHGDLSLTLEDFSWQGLRMPLSLNHRFHSIFSGIAYTGNDEFGISVADYSRMKLGLGFYLDLMQSMVSVMDEDSGDEKYIHVDENGTKYVLEAFDEKFYEDGNYYYNIFKDESGEMIWDPVERSLVKNDATYFFDGARRLVEIRQAEQNRTLVEYTDGRISTVTDSVGRVFSFTYDEAGYLTSIIAPDTTHVDYSYTNGLLTGISYPEGSHASVTYLDAVPIAISLEDAAGNSVYKVAYTYDEERLTGINEYGKGDVLGKTTQFSYTPFKTVVTEREADDEASSIDPVITTYTFDQDGELFSTYSSRDTETIANNLLACHSMERFDAWTKTNPNSTGFSYFIITTEKDVKYGTRACSLNTGNAQSKPNGIQQTTVPLPAGEYTFSAYVRVTEDFEGDDDKGVFLRVCDSNQNPIATGERIYRKDAEYTRLILPFKTECEGSVTVQILLQGKGEALANAAQLENGTYANAYNLLTNGDFEDTASVQWTQAEATPSVSVEESLHMGHSLLLQGDAQRAASASQQVPVHTARDTRETFRLSGWAKATDTCASGNETEETPAFRLRAAIKYNDSTYEEYGTEEYTADFTTLHGDWQYAFVEFSKSQYRTVEYIRVYCDYAYHTGCAYFDHLSLVRVTKETALSATDFVVELDSDGENATPSATADVEEANGFEEIKDAYGNTLTETTFTDGEFGTVYRSFGFAETGNDLVTETDARGNKTTYEVDPLTSRNKEVTDRCGNKTAYEYDNAGRTTKVTSKNADGAEIAHVSYAYDAFDNMTEIARGDGMKYALRYNAFHNLESIGIEGKDESLIRYTYKNGSGRLKGMTYANRHTMKAAYNAQGQMVSEKWFASEEAANDSTASPIAHYKYVYDHNGNIVRSIDITAQKEYNYEYEEERIVRATESDITLSGEIVTSKLVINAVKYYYDTEGNATKKVITSQDGSSFVYHFETSDDKTVVKFNIGKDVSSHSKSDSFGRKVFDELQLGSGFISRRFEYVMGEATREHTQAGKLKSSPTTQLVSRILLSDGRTIEYEYDAEERITKVVDSVDGTTEYTYDALGQLLTERRGGHIINSMTYDTYGNISSKNGKTYFYDSTWHDLLTGIESEAITYDAQGNPTSYFGHTLTWEKGRQLKSFDTNTYTYNEGGIRTSKTIHGVKHEYTLDGTKILKETWDGNTLIPLYDNEDSVCGIIYNGNQTGLEPMSLSAINFRAFLRGSA